MKAIQVLLLLCILLPARATTVIRVCAVHTIWLAADSLVLSYTGKLSDAKRTFECKFHSEGGYVWAIAGFTRTMDRGFDVNDETRRIIRQGRPFEETVSKITSDLTQKVQPLIAEAAKADPTVKRMGVDMIIATTHAPIKTACITTAPKSQQRNCPSIGFDPGDVLIAGVDTVIGQQIHKNSKILGDPAGPSKALGTLLVDQEKSTPMMVGGRSRCSPSGRQGCRCFNRADARQECTELRRA